MSNDLCIIELKGLSILLVRLLTAPRSFADNTSLLVGSRSLPNGMEGNDLL